MLITNLKALVVVLPLALAMFVVARPLCLRFMAEADFRLRRNVWIVLTIAAFSSPSFWLFALVAFPLIAWSAARDRNPVALYAVLISAIPAGVGLDIPDVGVQFFELTYHRILSLALLLPAAWLLVRAQPQPGKPSLSAMDALIGAFLVLQLALLMPHESITHTVRRGFLLFIDALLMYYVVSRSCSSRAALSEVLACFCLMAAIQVPIGLFETLKGWLLYTGIGDLWGDPSLFAYAFREGALRAQASAGHSISLGFTMALAFGFWLYLQARVPSAAWSVGTALWMWIGLLAAYSRSPWLVAAVFLFAHVGLAKGPISLLKVLSAAALIVGLVVVSPLGGRVIDNLPFVGTVDAFNVSYRQQLAERSWELIQRNPLLGNPFFLVHLEELRQGQGIIDLMNAYATIAMQFGLLGLVLFIAPIVIGMWNAFLVARRSADADLALLGANLIACMLATLFMLATGNLGSGQGFYLLAGLLAAYGRLGTQEGLRPARDYASSGRRLAGR